MVNAATIDDLRISAAEGYYLSVRAQKPRPVVIEAVRAYLLWRKLDGVLRKAVEHTRSRSLDHLPTDQLLKAASDLEFVCKEARALLQSETASRVGRWACNAAMAERISESTETLEDVAEAWRLAANDDFQALIGQALQEVDEGQNRPKGRDLAAV